MSSSTSSGETGKAIADLNTNYAIIFGNVVLAFFIKKTIVNGKPVAAHIDEYTTQSMYAMYYPSYGS
jgi:hypothetical protein